jgi:hypothetical protein
MQLPSERGRTSMSDRALPLPFSHIDRALPAPFSPPPFPPSSPGEESPSSSISALAALAALSRGPGHGMMDGIYTNIYIYATSATHATHATHAINLLNLLNLLYIYIYIFPLKKNYFIFIIETLGGSLPCLP